MFNSDFFVKCDMVIYNALSFIKSGVNIILPFKYHIKDINNRYTTTIGTENVLEDYPKEVYFSNSLYSKENEYISYLESVDLKMFSLDEESVKFLSISDKMEKVLNFYTFKDTRSLYYFLRDILKFTEEEFHMIKIFNQKNQLRLVKQYTKMVFNELELGNKSDKPNDIFMILRCAYELNHTATVFPENRGKSISEYSYRELCLQRSFLSKKCEIENIQLKRAEEGSKGV